MGKLSKRIQTSLLMVSTSWLSINVYLLDSQQMCIRRRTWLRVATHSSTILINSLISAPFYRQCALHLSLRRRDSTLGKYELMHSNQEANIMHARPDTLARLMVRVCFLREDLTAMRLHSMMRSRRVRTYHQHLTFNGLHGQILVAAASPTSSTTCLLTSSSRATRASAGGMVQHRVASAALPRSYRLMSSAKSCNAIRRARPCRGVLSIVCAFACWWVCYSTPGH